MRSDCASPAMADRFFPLSDHTPYSDRKHQRDGEAFLDMETMIAIQRMACEGKRPGEILDVYASQGVSMEQIMRLIDPPAERADGQGRRQERANVGFASFKGRR